MQSVKNFKTFAVWSNIFYLIPIIFVEYSPSLILTISLIGLFFISTSYHFYKSNWLDYADIIISIIVAGICLVKIFSSQNYNMYLWITIIFISLGLCVRYFLENGSRDDVPHGLWHLCVALSITFSILL